MLRRPDVAVGRERDVTTGRSATAKRRDETPARLSTDLGCQIRLRGRWRD